MKISAFWNKTNNNNEQAPEGLINLNKVVKIYQTTAGGYQALKSVNVGIHKGEFVGIIGKSGSGKSTLINMITGIDRPTSGEVWVNGSAIHSLSENQMARWRGRNLGIVFQFFQLLPNLSVVENVMLPMDFCNAYPLKQRRQRAMEVLEMVDMTSQADKLPAALSGGQQQRVAIARALANDPPVIIADEPTGNLDSKTAESVFQLFENLAAQGKTIVMVTHDSALARRVSRTIIIADGEVVNEFVMKALPALSPAVLLEISHKAQAVKFAPGETIIQQDTPGSAFYILTRGAAEVSLKRPGGSDVTAARMMPGQCFGEISLFNSTRTVATVRTAPDAPAEALALDKFTFQCLLDDLPAFREAMQAVVSSRMEHNQAVLVR